MRSWLACGSLLLVAGSWQLWTPQQLFPRVPLVAFPLAWSDGVDQRTTWFLLMAWLVVTVALTMPRLPESTCRWLSLAYSLLFMALVVLDQHRLQPWGVHIALCLLIVSVLEPKPRLSWLLLLTASIYIYSALSKFDAQFLHTVGQDFLAGLMQFWPGSYARLSELSQWWLAAAFPVGELACGAGLLWCRTRQLALWLAVVMHATLIFILGPWGLSHSWGVLLWNVLFVGLNILILRELRRSGPIETFWQVGISHGSSPALRIGRLCVGGLVTAMLVLPLGERLELVDHWLGWALYAPHSSRARVEVSSESVEHLPPVVKRFVRDDASDGIAPWSQVALERWSLETLGVPIYPQQRFYVAVARAIAQSQDEFGIRVTLMNTANRWSGARWQRTLESRQELEKVGQTYWFNTQPRW